MVEKKRCEKTIKWKPKNEAAKRIYKKKDERNSKVQSNEKEYKDWIAKKPKQQKEYIKRMKWIAKYKATKKSRKTE